MGWQMALDHRLRVVLIARKGDVYDQEEESSKVDQIWHEMRPTRDGPERLDGREGFS